MNIGDRVRFKDKPFLSDGNILSIPQHGFVVVKLDRKAPNEYAWNTDEVIALDDDIEVISN